MLFQPCCQCGCIRISGLPWALPPGPFCSSRSGGQAFNRSPESALLSALLRRRTRLFRQCRCSSQPRENLLLITQVRRQAGRLLCQSPLIQLFSFRGPQRWRSPCPPGSDGCSPSPPPALPGSPRRSRAWRCMPMPSAPGVRRRSSFPAIA